MNIALLYDTFETHNIKTNAYHCDFNDLAAMEAVKCALIELGHRVDIFTDLNLIKKSDFSVYDLVFNVFEGNNSRNREALIPGILEMKNIPFVGADAYVAIVSLDKTLSKIIAEHLDIKVPKCLEYSQLLDMNQDIRQLRLPLIVKPSSEGNSAGTRKFDNYEEAEEFIIEILRKYNWRIICEEFIEGMELTVPIIGNGRSAYCLGVAGYEEQVTDDFWLDYKYKLFGGFTDCVANIDSQIKDLICRQALKFYRYIGCVDYGRIDFRLDKNGVPYFLELNAYPTLCVEGSFAVLGKTLGLSYKEVIQQIIDAAYKRINHSNTI